MLARYNLQGAMVSYFIYITKIQLPLTTNLEHASGVTEALKAETNLASNLYARDFYSKPENPPPAQDKAHDLLVLKQGAIVIRLGLHVTIIGFKRGVVEDISSRIGTDPARLNIKRVRVNPQHPIT
jgi:hypothetical protein